MDYFRSKRFLDSLPDWETGRPSASPVDTNLPRMRSILDRLGRPQDRFRSVIIGGTNGKGTVCSLLAGILRKAGRRVGLYTSPHLHSIRERIQIDGAILEKETWAGSVGDLYDRTRLFEEEGLGAMTKFEALTGLAAHLFAHESVEFGIFEVGLGGRYDATNAWDAELAVLTSIDLDHTHVLGDTLLAILDEKFEITRPGASLLTTKAQDSEVLSRIHEKSVEKGLDLHVVPPLVRRDESEDGSASNGSTVFLENAALSLEAANHLIGGIDAGAAHSAIVNHRWPGRFEIVGTAPWRIIDGAHNPAAARSLVTDLLGLEAEWTFVVGVLRGHDVAGILRALAPAAKRFVFIELNHPRAVRAEEMERQVPEGASSTRVTDLESFLRDGPTSENLCITGSLQSAAEGLEALGRPVERDGFTEDLHQESLVCLEQACDELQTSLSPASEDGNLLRFEASERPVYFLRNQHPFNDYVSARIAQDKSYQCELFERAGLLIPPTMRVFNPLADVRFDRYRTHDSMRAIVEEVKQRFHYPVILKRNRGTLSQGVFLVENRTDLENHLEVQFTESGYFDNVFLIQGYLDGPEYRIVASGPELVLAYEKVSDEEGIVLDLNPLHHVSGRAIRVGDPRMLHAMQRTVEEVASLIHLGFYAIDIISNGGRFYVLEINPNPFCYFYNLHNGRDDFVRIYKRLVQKFLLAEGRSIGAAAAGAWPGK